MTLIQSVYTENGPTFDDPFTYIMHIPGINLDLHTFVRLFPHKIDATVGIQNNH